MAVKDENIRDLEKAISDLLIQNAVSDFRWITEEERSSDDNFGTCLIIDGDAHFYFWHLDGVYELSRVSDEFGHFIEPINNKEFAMSRNSFRSSMLIGVGFLLLGVSLNVVAANASLLDKAEAGHFTAPDLYSPTYIRYDNGLQLVLLPRDTARSVSLRVKVGVGMADFECGEKETPHALEHMVYGGLPDMTESDLEQRFWNLGIESQAYVADTATVFEAELYPYSLNDALNLTLRTLTESEFSETLLEQTRGILRQEAGGTPSKLEIATLAGGENASAWMQFQTELDAQFYSACPEFDQQRGMSLEGVRATYQNYYQPANMFWVIVGDFDMESIKAWGKQNLAKLENHLSIPARTQRDMELPKETVWRGFSSSSSAGLVFPTGGYRDEHHMALSVLESLLGLEVYNILRVEEGAAYAPSVYMVSDENWGWFVMQTDAAPDKREEAVQVMEQMLKEVSSEPLDEESFERLIQGLLRFWAQSPETNYGYADYFLFSEWEFKEYGRLIDYEWSIATLKPEDLQQAAKELLNRRSFYFYNDQYPDDAL